MEKVLVSWSGGKDCALAMHEILAGGGYQVVALLTTITAEHDRLDMHDIRISLIERQAQALGLPWEKVEVSSHTSNADYEPDLVQVLRRYRESGVTGVVFGDIFREDLRKYRGLNLARLGLRAIFPLWQREDFQLMESLISSGFKAIVVSVNTQALDGRFVGRSINWRFMFDFPKNASVCGEYGEYHTFVHDGPIFKSGVPFQVGDTFVRDDHFRYIDLIPN